jgi:hypothetical protein
MQTEDSKEKVKWVRDFDFFPKLSEEVKIKSGASGLCI